MELLGRHSELSALQIMKVEIVLFFKLNFKPIWSWLGVFIETFLSWIAGGLINCYSFENLYGKALTAFNTHLETVISHLGIYTSKETTFTLGKTYIHKYVQTVWNVFDLKLNGIEHKIPHVWLLLQWQESPEDHPRADEGEEGLHSRALLVQCHPATLENRCQFPVKLNVTPSTSTLCIYLREMKTYIRTNLGREYLWQFCS